MVRRPFGQGSQVSLFTLGTMRAIGSQAQMHAVVEAALSAGINHIETAPVYGPAESFLGSALTQLKKTGKEPIGGWVITSKLLPGIGFKEGQKQLRSLLDRLNLSRIDNLAVHGINQKEHLQWTIQGNGSDLFKWAKDKNLIGQIGFSSHGSISLIEEAIESDHFQFCSLHLHLIDPTRIPLAQHALSKGMGVMAISPADKGGRLQSPSQTLIEDCKPIAPLELAYRFLLSKGISTLTVGALKPEDLALAKNLATSDGPIDDCEQNAIGQFQIREKNRLGESQCGQCRKCLPCPKEVPIPEILRLRNLTIGHDLQEFAKDRYNLIGRAGHWWEQKDASACEKCGACLPRCPNQLPIPQLLEDTHHRLAEAPRRRLWDRPSPSFN